MNAPEPNSWVVDESSRRAGYISIKDIKGNRLVAFACMPGETADHSPDELAKLIVQLPNALDALRELHDWQNGPPLPKYEEGWTRAMESAQRVLKACGA